MLFWKGGEVASHRCMPGQVAVTSFSEVCTVPSFSWDPQTSSHVGAAGSRLFVKVQVSPQASRRAGAESILGVGVRTFVVGLGIVELNQAEEFTQ